MAPRVNLFRGLHRLLLVGWVLWALALIGPVTWEYWNLYRYSSHFPTLKEFLEARARHECSENLKSGRTGEDRNLPEGVVPLEEFLNCANYVAQNPPRENTQIGAFFSKLVLAPAALYGGLFALAYALRWVWRGLLPGEPKDTV